jgi:uncharacterized protein with von Willebrand factor type A (vWA) domain
MLLFRYSEWDGSQEIVEFDPEELMDQLSENLMSYSDLQYSLRQMFQNGMRNGDQRMPGMQDLLQRLRNRRREQLERYDMDSVFDDIQAQLDEILDKESGAVQRALDPGEERGTRNEERGDQQVGPPSDQGSAKGKEAPGLSADEMAGLQKFMKARAQEKQDFLDALPDDAGGRIKELSNYEFMDPDAQNQFNELLEKLKQQVMDSYFKNISQAIENMSPEDMARMQQMVRDLNQMLRDRMDGKEPDSDQFMEKYGDLFQGMNPQSLDDLIEKLQRQMAGMQSLMDSMSPDMRQSLMDMLQSKIMDPGMRQQMAELAMNLETLFPMRGMRRQYPFQGSEQLGFDEAMDLMQQLQRMDDLEKQMERTRMGGDLDSIDGDALRELLGDDAARDLENLKDLAKRLEEAGYIQQRGDRYDLTPRGIRRIGQKALRDIFQKLDKDKFGTHKTERTGVGIDRADSTKAYEFGDPPLIDLQKTVMNAIFRNGPGTPVRLNHRDFEIDRTEQLTDTTIVLMLDLSWSMVLRGNFLPAKKVALALNTLMKQMFPRDHLYVVGFSDYARELKGDALPYLNSHEAVYGTNMQHGFQVAQRLFARHRSANQQIIMITDGEPTAFIENGQSYFEYPPTPQIFRETLREVKHCTRKGIVINTFMLDRSEYLRDFINMVTRINKGRAFYTTPDRLGNYILVDYLTGKRRNVA